MARKIALASIACVVLGSVAIPGGFLLDDLIVDLTYTSIDDGLLGIKRDAGPVVSELVLCTFKAFIMDTMLNKLNFTYEGFEVIEEAISSNKLFNDPNAEFHVDKEAMLTDVVEQSPLDFKVGYVDILTINGLQKYISDEHGMSVDFSETTQKLLLNGNEKLPGLINDTNTGSGVNEFLELYEANANTLAIQYQCSTEALDAVVLYLNEYYENEKIPQFLEGVDIELELETGIEILLAAVGLTVDDLVDLPPHIDIIPIFMPELTGAKTIYEIAMIKFFDQWANASLIPPPGFPLPLAHGIEHYGFEVGLPIATNMSRSSVDALWDENSNYALVSDVGKHKWINLAAKNDSNIYNQLKSYNNLTDHAMNCTLSWLPGFQLNLMPYLAEYEYNLPMNSIALASMLEISLMVIGAGLIVIGALTFTRDFLSTRKYNRTEGRILRVGYSNVAKKIAIPQSKISKKKFKDKLMDQSIPEDYDLES